MAFSLPKLPYDFGALEPHIDAQTMEIHYTKHHQGYADKLNAALDGHDEWMAKSLEEILTHLDQLPDKVRTAVRNNGGGLYNHSLFWDSLSPNGGGEPNGELRDAIETAFESWESFQENFSAAAAGRFGSGWAWLVLKDDGTLDITDTPNQDNPIMEDATLTPLLGLDVWEHAYYLNYQNRRADYISAWWHVVNWEEVAKRYSQAQ